MRVSTNKSDLSYTREPGKYEIYLDGKYLDNCFTADEENGYVLVYTGGIDYMSGEIKYTRLEGKVEIKIVDEE